MDNSAEAESSPDSDKFGGNYTTCNEEDRDELHAVLEKESLGHLNRHFPDCATVDYFKALTEDDLEHDLKIKNEKDRIQLMRCIAKLRVEDSDDENESESDIGNCSIGSQSEVFASSTLPKNFRFNRNRLSDDFGGRWRGDSLSCSQTSRYEETSNLVRMRANPSLGNSEPNLSGSCGDLSRRLSICNIGSRKQAKSFIGTSSSPSNSQRAFSPHPPASPGSLCSDSPVGSPNWHVGNASHFKFSNVRKTDSCRRWSVASLSSGYGTHTPCSSSYSSLASSQEKLQFQMGQSSGEDFNYASHFSAESDAEDDMSWRSPKPRQRSRSLSPHRSFCSHEDELQLLNNLYKDRFPNAKKQMEEKLMEFIDDYTSETWGSVFGCDGVLNFVWHQVVEAARDVLAHSQEDSLTSLHFYELSENMEHLIYEAMQKTEVDLTPVRRLMRKLLIIVSRPARLLECLEFKPGEYYNKLEVEGHQMSSLQDEKPDITRYVRGQLGLNPKGMCTEPTGSTDVLDARNEAPTPTVTPTTTKLPSEEDFDYIKLISNGAFGAVYLVRHKDTHMRFAMKKISKHHMLDKNQIEQVFAERDILTFAENPFVVGLWCCFETKKHLCMVMEYVEGGDTASLLKNIGALPVDLATMYFAETVLAVEYLHSYGVVHRDIKPDNLLITSLGHIKLTDFGLSKIGLMNSTTRMYEHSLDTQQFTDKQVFGTPDYLAPEVILRQGYGRGVDWWSMGIILYEFLLGVPPFYGDTPEDLFAHTLSGEIDGLDGDESPPEEASDLIRGLLEQDPNRRLGSAGAIEVKEHMFFDGLDWNALLRQKAEFIPQLEGEEDTSYFDSRSDRYNHSFETDDDDDDELDIPEFSNFSTCSPRYSRILASPGPPSPASITSEDSDKSPGRARSDSSPPAIRRHGLDEREPSSLVDGTEDFPIRRPRPRSDSGFALGLRSPSNSPALDSPMTPPTPPTVRLRKKSSITRFPPLLTTLQMDQSGEGFSPSPAASPAPSPSTPTRGEKPPNLAMPSLGDKEHKPVELRVQVHRTMSLPPDAGRSRPSVPKLELPVSDDELRLHISTTDSPPGSPRHNTPPMSPRKRRTSTVSLSLRPPIVIEKGPRGYGFTLQAIRVYYGDTNYYTVHHLVSGVDHGSAAFEAGLRPGDLLTHVNDESVTGLTHRHVVERILVGGDKVKLNATELSKTSIKTGGRKRAPSAGKRIKKRHSIRHSRRSTTSPTMPPTTPDSGEKTPKRRPFWKPFSRRKSHSPSTSLRRSSSLKRMNSLEGKRPTSPKLGSPSFDFRNVSDQSSSSSLSSAASSPSSPTTNSLGRPGTLHGLIPKLRSVHSPRRKYSAHVPVSPLARTPSPTSSSPSQPPRSTSPLTLKNSPNSPHYAAVAQSAVPRPASPLLRRALSPDYHGQGKEKGEGDNAEGDPSRAPKGHDKKSTKELSKLAKEQDKHSKEHEKHAKHHDKHTKDHDKYSKDHEKHSKGHEKHEKHTKEHEKQDQEKLTKGHEKHSKKHA